MDDIHLAAMRANSDEDLITLAAAAGGSVSKPDSYGTTALHLASEMGFVSNVRTLLQLGADPFAQDCCGFQPIHHAAQKGFAQVIELLVGGFPELVHTTSNVGYTCLHIVAERNHVEALRMLVLYGSNTNAITTKDSRSPLHVAALAGSCEAIVELHHLGAIVHLEDGYGRSALRYAVHQGNTRCVSALLALGADVDQVNQFGCSPLHYAAMRGDDNVVSLLLHSGANVELTDNHSRTPLHLAAIEGHASTAQVLVDLGADVTRKNKYGSNALHYAAMMGHTPCAEALISAGANPADANNIGNTPLHVSASKGHITFAKLMVNAAGKESIDAENSFGASAMHAAASVGHADVIASLVGMGANVESKRRDGYTPLMAAANAGHIEAVRVLLSMGSVNRGVLELASNESVVCLLQATQRLQDFASRGQAQLIRAEIESDCMLSVPVVQWVALLTHKAAREIQSWARCMVDDADACFAALYYRGDGGGKNATRLLRDVAHDGVPHIQGLIASFLVYQKASTRKCLRELLTLRQDSGKYKV